MLKTIERIPKLYLLKYPNQFLLTSTFMHEEAHGMYYLIPEYKTEVDKIIKSFSTTYFNKLCKRLANRGYPPTVFFDEIQAYGVDKKQKKFYQLFKKYRLAKLDKL